MSTQVQFKVSAIVVAISMMMAGSAMATDVGNVVVGPDIDSGVAHVNINQVGTGNVLSSDATAGTPANGAFVVNTGTGTLSLTVQQVGVSGETPSGSNLAAINAYTTNAATKIRLFQGGETAGPGGTTGVGTGSNDIGVDMVATGNKATITLGSIDTRSGASEILVSQQGNDNVAALTLGSTAFQGVMQVMQLGSTNTANVTVSGQTTAKTFNIGQAGNTNTLKLTAVNMGGNVTANFGDLSFASAFTSSKPAVTDSAGGNNAATYVWGTSNTRGVTASTDVGINLGSTAGFNLSALGGSNNVQVDLATAGTGSKVDVNLIDGSSNFAVYGKNSAAVNLGGTSALTVNDSKELAVYANGGTVSVNGVTFNGNGYFSTAASGSITMSGGTVTTDGMSVLQSGAAHSFSSTNDAASTATWNVAQTGPVVSSITANNTAAAATGGSFTLTQTSATDGGAHEMTLNNSAASTTWTVTQTGAGAKTLEMTNSTTLATIDVSQTGALAQSATAINFAAASGSTFYLAQK